MKALQFQTIRKLSGAKITHLRIRVLKEVFLANLKLTNNSSQTRFFRCLVEKIFVLIVSSDIKATF
jgi:hypothetical protein